jgi:hypothetical protein
MAKWRKDTYRLPDDLKWDATPGYQTFVADRGAVRFDFPSGWLFEPGESSLKFRDRAEPDDTCILELTIFHLPPGTDWTALPLTGLLEDCTKGGDEEVLSSREPVYLKRGDFEIAWNEKRYVDPAEHREAVSRCLMARRGLIQPLFTFAYWPEDAARLGPVWDVLLRSLRLGEYVAFPIRGDRN